MYFSLCRSTLILEGDVDIEGLQLDGALVLKASPGNKVVVRNEAVNNRGWEVCELDETALKSEPIPIQIRGYKIVKHEETVMTQM